MGFDITAPDRLKKGVGVLLFFLERKILHHEWVIVPIIFLLHVWVSLQS